VLTALLIQAGAVSIPALDRLSESAIRFAFFQGALAGGLLVLTIVYALGRKNP
jgi:hypothetical protein